MVGAFAHMTPQASLRAILLGAGALVCLVVASWPLTANRHDADQRTYRLAAFGRRAAQCGSVCGRDPLTRPPRAVTAAGRPGDRLPRPAARGDRHRPGHRHRRPLRRRHRRNDLHRRVFGARTERADRGAHCRALQQARRSEQGDHQLRHQVLRDRGHLRPDRQRRNPRRTTRHRTDHTRRRPDPADAGDHGIDAGGARRGEPADRPAAASSA